MNRRDLLKTLGLTTAAVITGQFNKSTFLFAEAFNTRLKNWAWLTTDLKTPIDEWKRKFAKMKESGIHAILPEIFDSRFAYYGSNHLPVADEWLERILPIAKSEGLEVHAWMWTMICNIEKIYKEHPEWYMVNGNGESCIDNPAYVNYYKFLCPSRNEALEFIAERVRELARYDQLDGIHFDYIRYPDVIISKALQPKYGLVQDREYPEFDYCYCEVCRKKFKEQNGIDPADLESPYGNMEWKQYRYDTISNFVNNKLIPIAREQNKVTTAAVFPPYNRLYVRQQWPNWNLDAVMPMIYHNFYYEDILWIYEQTEKGVHSLRKDEPLYSGLMISQFSPNGFKKAIEASINGGAKGIALFSANAMRDEQWETLRQVTAKYK